MVIRCKLEEIKVSKNIFCYIDSIFDENELSIISKEISIIKKEKYLNEQIHIGGNILGNMMGNEDYFKILTLSKYIDELVSMYQKLQRNQYSESQLCVS